MITKGRKGAGKLQRERNGGDSIQGEENEPLAAGKKRVSKAVERKKGERR